MQETINFINNKINDFKPELGIILGSGLGDFADEFCDIAIDYTDIPNFENSTIKGHKGRLVFAEIEGKRVVLMQGRFHFYEGHPMSKVVFPIKVMKQLGVKTLIITNAAGGVNKTFSAGDLMLITDHLNLMGTNPLIGLNDQTLGERFPDMSEVYKKDLIEIAFNCGKTLGIDLKKGVYAAFTGPSYETPAEIKMLQTMGADAVGMSTIPEAIVANYCKIKVLGISCISNLAAGVGASQSALSHQEVIETTNQVKSKFKSLLLEIIGNIQKSE